jgi:hypothetical protein
VYVFQEAVRYLADRVGRTVGVSVGGFHKDSVETHQALLGAGIWVIESLYPSGIEPGEYEWSACRSRWKTAWCTHPGGLAQANLSEVLTRAPPSMPMIRYNEHNGATCSGGKMSESLDVATLDEALSHWTSQGVSLG